MLLVMDEWGALMSRDTETYPYTPNIPKYLQPSQDDSAGPGLLVQLSRDLHVSFPIPGSSRDGGAEPGPPPIQVAQDSHVSPLILGLPLYGGATLP